MEQKEGFMTKPLVSILDLGKLLLQYSRDGDADKVHELIVKGAPFNADWLGMTPLHYAAKRNNYEICDMLLRGGINKDARTKVDRTALHFAVYENNESIVELLLSRNVDVNVKDMLRMTALHWAVEKGYNNIAQLLIKYGADVTLISKFDKSPMSIAIQTGQCELFKDLFAMKQNQRSKILSNRQENELETNAAVDSIKIEPICTPKLESPTRTDEETTEKKQSKQIYYQKKTLTNLSNRYSDRNDQTHVKEEHKQMEQSALEILKSHGITMLPQENSQNLLSAALEGGRKLVLSEAGKLILKGNDKNKVFNSEGVVERNLLRKMTYGKIFLPSRNNKKMPATSCIKTVAPSKNNKNVKIISMDMFKRMYGDDFLNSFNKNSKPNISDDTTQATLTKLVKLNNVSEKKPMHPKTNIQTTPRQEVQTIINEPQKDSDDDYDDLPPNIIEVCSESDSEDNQTAPHQLSYEERKIRSRTVLEVTSQVQNKVVMDVPELCRQMIQLRKQFNELRQQFERIQKQNEEYKYRLDYLERNDVDS